MQPSISVRSGRTHDWPASPPNVPLTIPCPQHQLKTSTLTRHEDGDLEGSMNERSLDKIIFPKDGLTKGDVVDYYERIAPVMLPHIQNRPLMLQRCPEGIESECIFQKNIDTYFPNSI